MKWKWRVPQKHVGSRELGYIHSTETTAGSNIRLSMILAWQRSSEHSERFPCPSIYPFPTRFILFSVVGSHNQGVVATQTLGSNTKSNIDTYVQSGNWAYTVCTELRQVNHYTVNDQRLSHTIFIKMTITPLMRFVFLIVYQGNFVKCQFCSFQTHGTAPSTGWKKEIYSQTSVLWNNESKPVPQKILQSWAWPK